MNLREHLEKAKYDVRNISEMYEEDKMGKFLAAFYGIFLMIGVFGSRRKELTNSYSTSF